MAMAMVMVILLMMIMMGNSSIVNNDTGYSV